MNNKKRYKELIAFHPGSYVEDIIDDLNITQEEFAHRLGELPKTVSKLVNGEIKLSAEVAYKLEKLTGVDYQTWMNLQSGYDKKIIEIENEKCSDEPNIADDIDISYFKKCNFLENRAYKKHEKISCLRNIFNVSNLSYLNVFNPSVSYRNIKDFKQKSIVNSNIMLELASKIARDKTDTKLDKNKLRALLPEIKNMISQDINTFFPLLEKKLLECGIVLVALPHLKNSNLHGATKKFKNGSVLLLVTDRNKFADIFWFSLMHEIGHILNGDFYTDIDSYEDKEREADAFAQDFLIDPDDYGRFVGSGDFSKESIVEFSAKIGMPSFIVAGRLKKDGHIDYAEHLDLMLQYEVTFHVA